MSSDVFQTDILLVYCTAHQFHDMVQYNSMWSRPSLVCNITVWHLYGAKPLHEPKMNCTICLLDHWEIKISSLKFESSIAKLVLLAGQCWHKLSHQQKRNHSARYMTETDNNTWSKHVLLYKNLSWPPAWGIPHPPALRMFMHWEQVMHIFVLDLGHHWFR